MGRFSRVLRRQTNDRGALLPMGVLLLLAAFLGAGCGDNPGTTSTADGNAGLMLPPGFKPVDLPVERRKAIFREVHITRALALQEANQKLSMDADQMPKANEAFEKRVAEHDAILKGILDKNLPALADRNKISMADLTKIEEEARMLRWTPPQEPQLGEKVPASETKGRTGKETRDETK